MRVTNLKECYCHNCGRDFHYLGITRHRKAHLERGETVKITYTHGDTYTHEPSARHKNKEGGPKREHATR